MMTQPTTLIVDLPTLAKAELRGDKRMIYFEATREGVVDREGEMVAADALWRSRDLMLEQGDFDISHWAHLPNPITGRPQPEYRIGLPTQITRQGKSIYVAGEIYSNKTAPPDEQSSGHWADRFWHSLTGQSPAAKWFPSVYGKINPGGIEVVTIKGQQVRRIISVQWHSVGFALRAQHPDLPAVSMSPVGNLIAKADSGSMAQRLDRNPDVLHLDYQQFAKAVSAVGLAPTDHAAMSGPQALVRQSLDKKVRNGGVAPRSTLKARVRVLQMVKSGHVQPTLADLRRAFMAHGLKNDEARAAAKQLFSDLKN